MAYVMNRRGIYRTGFRPAPRATNPFAAAQLSGVPARRAASPFAPEFLRLGQHQPFPASGGYGLHGLGNTIPDQSVVTWTGQISGTPSLSIQDVVSAASVALQSDGLNVISTSGMPFALFDVDIQISSAATVTLTLQVNNGLGYSQPQDIAAIVNHEIFAASG